MHSAVLQAAVGAVGRQSALSPRASSSAYVAQLQALDIHCVWRGGMYRTQVRASQRCALGFRSWQVYKNTFWKDSRADLREIRHRLVELFRYTANAEKAWLSFSQVEPHLPYLEVGYAC